MRILICFILFLVQLAVNAQDTIFKRDGQILSVKVMEVNIKELSYKRTDLLDGPLFIINKDEIKQVKYFNGVVDVFPIIQNVEQVVVYSNPRDAFVGNNQILSDLRRGKYIYHGRTISDRKVLFLAFQKNQLWNNQEVKLNISASKRHKVLQYTFGYGGSVIGGISLCAAAFGGDVSSSSNEAAVAAFFGILSAGVVVSSQIVAFKYKLKRLKHADKVVDLYNQLNKE